MNRRSFLIGLLSTTAAPVVAKALPSPLPPGEYFAEIESVSIRTGLPIMQWRILHQGVPIHEVASINDVVNHFVAYGQVQAYPIPNGTVDDG